MKAKPFYFYIILAGVFSAMAPVASDLYLPSIPNIAYFYHTSINLVQFSITTFVLGFACSRLIMATLSDFFGRRRPLLIALVVCCIGAFGCLFSPNIWLFLVSRFIQGFGAGGSNVLARVILRDTVPVKELPKYNSYNSMVAITLMAAAPMVGGYIQHYLTWFVVFRFLTVYAIFACVLAFFVIPETNQHYHDLQFSFKKITQNFVELIKSVAFIRFAFIVFLVYGVLLAWLSAGAVVLQKVVMLTPVQYGWCAAFAAAGYFLGSLLNSRIVSRVGVKVMMTIGALSTLIAGICMLILFLMFHMVNTPAIIIPAFIALFGSSLIFANVYATALIPYAKMAGIAIAVLGTTQLLGGVVTSAIISILPDVNQLPLALIIFISALLILWLLYKMNKENT